MRNASTYWNPPLRNVIVTLVLIACLSPVPAWTAGAAPSELLEKALYAEETKGDLGEAAGLYQQIVLLPNAPRRIAAQAQLRLGLCLLKQGEKPKALAALEVLIRDYPDKDGLLGSAGKSSPAALDEVVRQIEENYVRPVDRNELVSSAIKAILGKLDDQSDFIVGRDLEMLNAQVKQQIAGIGAHLKFDATGRRLLVVTPLPSSPAFKGGLRPGDEIVDVDGQLVADFPEGKEMVTAIAEIQGKPGDPIAIGVRRAAGGGLERITLVRDIVRLPTVKGVYYREDGTAEHMALEDPRIGYLRITMIGKETPSEVEIALRDLEGRGVQGVILDLRDTPGGLLDESTMICDLFVADGTIVTVRSRDKEPVIYRAQQQDILAGTPMVVLVNRVTASAAEIIAACLQDHRRAVVIGERTFGQGLVKSMFTFDHGAAALKLPTGAYFRPSGKEMHRFPESKETDDWGVRPDPGFEVAYGEEESKRFRESLEKREVLGVSALAVAFVDRQLDKGIEYLRGQGTR